MASVKRLHNIKPVVISAEADQQRINSAENPGSDKSQAEASVEAAKHSQASLSPDSEATKTTSTQKKQIEVHHKDEPDKPSDHGPEDNTCHSLLSTW